MTINVRLSSYLCIPAVMRPVWNLDHLGQVCFLSPESKLNLEKQRLVFILHISGTNSQKTWDLLQLSVLWNWGLRHFCLLLPFIKSNNYSFYPVFIFCALNSLITILIAFKCLFMVCFFCTVLMLLMFYVKHFEFEWVKMCYINKFCLVLPRLCIAFNLVT